MSLRRISWLVACLVIPIAVGCGQESEVVKEEEPVSVTPGDVPDPRPLMGELVIDDIGMALDHWGATCTNSTPSAKERLSSKTMP